MPEVTFLVAVNVEDLTSLPDQALDIQDDLESAGHDVVSVKPWARPSQQASIDAFSTLIQPQQTQLEQPQTQPPPTENPI